MNAFILKIFVYALFLNLIISFSFATNWFQLNESQHDELFLIAQNFDNYSDSEIFTIVKEFVFKHNITSKKKILSKQTLSSQENFINALEYLCRRNEDFVADLEGLKLTSTQKQNTNKEYENLTTFVFYSHVLSALEQKEIKKPKPPVHDIKNSQMLLPSFRPQTVKEVNLTSQIKDSWDDMPPIY